MDSLILTDEEIECINSFIEEAKQIPVIEGVYLIPFRNGDDFFVNVCIVWNYYDEYEKLLVKEGFKPNAREDLMKKNVLLNSFRKKYNDVRLSYITECRDILAFPKEYNPDMFYEVSSLVSGTIIYDRFKELSALREEALELFVPFEQVVPIENLDRIISTGSVTR